MTHGSGTNLALVMRLCQGSYCLRFSCGLQNGGVISRLCGYKWGSVLVFSSLFVLSHLDIFGVFLFHMRLSSGFLGSVFLCIFFCSLWPSPPLDSPFLSWWGSFIWYIIIFGFAFVLFFLLLFTVHMGFVQIGHLEVVDKRGLVDTSKKIIRCS